MIRFIATRELNGRSQPRFEDRMNLHAVPVILKDIRSLYKKLLRNEAATSCSSHLIPIQSHTFTLHRSHLTTFLCSHCARSCYFVLLSSAAVSKRPLILLICSSYHGLPFSIDLPLQLTRGSSGRTFKKTGYIDDKQGLGLLYPIMPQRLPVILEKSI